MPANKQIRPQRIAEAPAPEAAQPAASHAPATDGTAPDARAALFARIVRTAHLRMDTIEGVLKGLQEQPAPESERTARTLAMLDRSLREIAALTKPDETAPSDETDDDTVPRDIDEFRRELARRIRGMVDAERSRASEDSDEAPPALA